MVAKFSEVFSLPNFSLRRICKELSNFAIARDAYNREILLPRVQVAEKFILELFEKLEARKVEIEMRESKIKELQEQWKNEASPDAKAVFDLVMQLKNTIERLDAKCSKMRFHEGQKTAMRSVSMVAKDFIPISGFEDIRKAVFAFGTLYR